MAKNTSDPFKPLPPLPADASQQQRADRAALILARREARGMADPLNVLNHHITRIREARHADSARTR